MRSYSKARRSTARIAAVFGLAAASLVVTAIPAAAETSLVAEAGFDGVVSPGKPFPITIRITTDELFQGELRITGDGPSAATVRRVEVPGGTTREIVAVVQSSPWGVGASRIELIDGDVIIATENVRPQVQNGDDLVGVYGSLATNSLPESVPLTVDAGDARLHALGEESFRAGWVALAPLDMIVISSADLRSLDGTSGDTLMSWVSQGGRLLVDEPAGADIPVIPAEWQPSGTTPRAAGRGEIVLTGGAAAAGDWDSMFEPTPISSQSEAEGFAEFGQFWGAEPLSWTLGRDAGFQLPSLGWVITILAAYVAVAGPLTWFALRTAGRPGLAWLMVPAAAVVFAGGIWMLGSSFRDSTKPAHGTIIEAAPRGSTVTSYTLLNSRNGGAESIDLPTGWVPVSSLNEGQSGAITVAPNGAGTSLSMELDAGGFAIFGGAGTAQAFDNALTVTASSQKSGSVSGSVTNNLAVDLHEVVIFADQAGRNIGTVAAGATTPFELNGQVANPFNGEPIEFKVWRDSMDPRFTGFFDGQNLETPDTAVNLSLWAELTQQSVTSARPVGQVVVAGWTDQLNSPVDPTIDSGRTLVTARTGIVASGSDVSSLAISQTQVRGSASLGREFRATDFWGGGAMFRFVLPEGRTDHDFVLSVPKAQRRIDLWIGDAWQQLAIDGNDSATIALPPEAVADGRVYIKILLDFERGMPTQREVAVRSRTAADDNVLAIGFLSTEEAVG